MHLLSTSHLCQLLFGAPRSIGPSSLLMADEDNDNSSSSLSNKADSKLYDPLSIVSAPLEKVSLLTNYNKNLRSTVLSTSLDLPVISIDIKNNSENTSRSDYHENFTSEVKERKSKSKTVDFDGLENRNKLRGGKLLDIGAGDGRVTSQLAPLFSEVTTTEVSHNMVKRLRSRGFKCFETSDLRNIPFEGGYDVISFLNVLDRCNEPITILKNMRRLMRSGNSRLLLAVPLPLSPAVESGSGWKEPKERLLSKRLCCRPYAWEQSVIALVREVFTKVGLQVESVSRLPYLSQGDGVKSYYVLDDAVFVLAPIS